MSYKFGRDTVVGGWFQGRSNQHKLCGYLDTDKKTVFAIVKLV